MIPTPSDTALLTDGTHEARGTAIGEAVESLVAQLRAQGVGPADYLAFHCAHDLPSALLWLALLRAGCSAFVSASGPRVSPAEAPAFCRLSVRAGWDGAATVSADERPAWNGARVHGEPRMVFRTSGSTGASKLVAHTSAHLLANSKNCVDRLNLRETDRMAIPVPIYHMYGLGAAFLPGTMAAASMDFQGASNVLRYIEREAQFRPNVAFLTPAFMNALVKSRRRARPYDLTVVAGDLLAPDLCRAYEARFGAVVSLYGSTEMGAVAAASPIDSPELRARTVGHPMAGVECLIDSQLRVRHPHGFDGYMDERGHVHPHLADQWFPTNDRAEWDDGGRLRILGRVDDCVNRDGVLVPLIDIEAAVRRVSDIEAAVAIAAGRSARGRGVVAFCTVTAGVRLDGGDVRRACVGAMPPSHVPDRVEILAALPTLPSGKPDRVALARLAGEEA